MAINNLIVAAVEERLSVKITGVQPVSGGSINQAYRLQTNSSDLFIKVNSEKAFPTMFRAEAAGIEHLRQTGAIAVPGIILQAGVEDESFLILEWIDCGPVTARASAQMGRNLAQMHKCTSGSFGLEYDNYMGSLPQSNTRHQTWSSFFIEQRLQPMVQMAARTGLLNNRDIKDFDTLYKSLPGLFSEEPPSLIHGDLWRGNYLADRTGKPYLIDPAVSYGNREFDLAMTTLFGGFSAEFYMAYEESFPLLKGWKQRIDLWNLYPLLIHLNLFGSSYLEEVRASLSKYI